jgi:hypothetical protein
LAKNRSLNAGIKMSPFKATFGVDCRNGLEMTAIPSDKWTQLNIEEDLLAMCNAQKDSLDIPDTLEVQTNDTEQVLKNDETNDAVPLLENKIENIQKIREEQIALRTAIKELSLTGGQGMTKCNCTGACDSQKCTCKKKIYN